MEEDKNKSSEFNSLTKRYNSLWGNPKDIDDENENIKDKNENIMDKNENIMDSEIKLKKYNAAEAVISLAKGLFYIIAFMSVTGMIYIGSTFDFSPTFWASLIPISIFLLLAYAQIQMIELFFDIGKNTNQTNILIQKLINKIKE